MRWTLPTLLAAALAAQDIGPTPLASYGPPIRTDIVQSVAGMAGDAAATALFRAHGLDLLSLTWEDTGRWKNSALGPNISDLTIQVLGGAGSCMPVVRYPNFADKSCDVAIDRFKLLVGNERGGGLTAIDLRSYLRDFARFQHAATGRVKGELCRSRDQVALASAQACFLPIAQGGAATFAPVIFNYQSTPGEPAVLAILVTPEGTSAQVIDNNSAASAGVWHGQRLFHNADGQRAPLRAERFSDHRDQFTEKDAPAGGEAARRDGLSLVLVVQVPLVHREAVRALTGGFGNDQMKVAAGAPMAELDVAKRGSDVETAVVGAGPVEGPWLGLDGCTIERDWRFPIRVTVQFYQATSSAVVDQDDATRIAKAIERIYLDADAVGSLVVDGMTGRPTEHHVAPQPMPLPLPMPWPQAWWQQPCEDYTRRSGEPWAVAVARVRERLGADWQPADRRELRNALALVRP